MISTIGTNLVRVLPSNKAWRLALGVFVFTVAFGEGRAKAGLLIGQRQLKLNTTV